MEENGHGKMRGLKVPRSPPKYCKRCDNECVEYMTGNVICPICRKYGLTSLKPDEYYYKTNKNNPIIPMKKRILYCQNCRKERAHDWINGEYICKKCGLKFIHLSHKRVMRKLKYRKKTKLKILLHSPLHPSYWVYLMETMPEHEWFIEPSESFEEGLTPRDHLNYTVVPRNTKIEFDVQIFCLNSHFWVFEELMRTFGHIPIVFLDFYGANMPSLRIKYPLLSCCRHNSRPYTNKQYVYVPPSRTLWNRDWEGDIRKVFIPAQSYLQPKWAHTFAAKLIHILEKTDLKLDIVLNRTRVMPWKEWQEHFIHDRVLLDVADKHSSFVLEEAMTIGMPVISRNIFETPWVVRDKVDGFTKWNEKQLIKLLHKFLDADNSFAKEWSLKSRKRGKEILSAKETNLIWNSAFQNAIKLNPPAFSQIGNIAYTRR